MKESYFREQILQLLIPDSKPGYILDAIGNEPYLKRPRSSRFTNLKVDKTKFCAFHQKHGHKTEHLVRKKRLLQFVKGGVASNEPHGHHPAIAHPWGWKAYTDQVARLLGRRINFIIKWHHWLTLIKKVNMISIV